MHIELTCVKYVCDWEIPVNHMLRRRAHAISITKADTDSDNDLDASVLSKQKVLGETGAVKNQNKTAVG